MKKLKLKNLKLQTNDLLQRNELKTVFGGYGGYDPVNYICQHSNSAGGTITRVFLPGQEALAMAYGNAWGSLGYPCDWGTTYDPDWLQG